MSLINQMLKDLEQRRAQGLTDEDSIVDKLDPGRPAAAKGRRNNALLLVLGLLLITATALIWLLFEGHLTLWQSDTQPVAIAKPAHEQMAAIKSETVTPPPLPVTTTGVLDDAMQLEAIPDVAVETAPLQKHDKPAERVAEPVALETEQEPKVAAKKAPVAIVVSGLSPSPIKASGEIEIIKVTGEGFIEPLRVVMEWSNGRNIRALQPWQVKVLSQAELELHVNPGREADTWSMRIEQTETGAEGRYSFDVVTARQVETVSPEPVVVPEVVEKPEPVSVVVRQQRVQSEESRLNALFVEASRHLQRGAHDRAEQGLREVLQQDQAHIDARQTLAALYFSGKQFSQAKQLLTEGRVQHPQHVPFVLMLARTHIELGQDGLAISVLETMTPAVADHIDYYALLAALYQRSANYAGASQTYQKLLQVSPRRGVWWMGLGLSLQAQQKNTDALTAYRKALAAQGLSTELRRFIQSRINSLGS